MAVAAKKTIPEPPQTAEAAPKPKAARTPRAASSGPRLSLVGGTPRPAPFPQLQAAAAALELSRANTFLCDLNFEIVYANQKSYDMLAFMEPNLHRHSDSWKSFRAADVVGMNMDFLFADEPLEFRRASDPRNLPYQAQIKTGPCVCDLQVSGLRDSSGTLYGYAVDWERITDKLAQQRRTEQLMQVLEDSSANTLLCDLNWNVLYANKKSYEVLEFMEPNLHRHHARWHSFKAREIVGKSIDWMFTDEPEEFRRAADVRSHPYHGQIKTGPCVCDVQITSTRDNKGEVTGYAVYWERVTEKLKLEAQAQAQIEEGQYLAIKVEEMKAVALAITQGDLTRQIPIEKDDAVGQLAHALNDMVSNLSQLVAQVQVASENIVSSSQEVAAGNDDLSRRTEEQASSLEETASSMEEMTSTVKQNADNARQANQLATQARDVAEKGGGVVSKAVTSMEEINKASKRIADIISVIDEIAFQTNLLALNAAVEAARVGEQGRGFAVVATEVRNLAGRSATAAKEIKSLVQDSVQKVQEGSTLVNQSGQQLDEIVGSVKKVADIIAEISAAGQEQAAGIEQVNKAIMQMDQITQQNAALVEEATASSQAMSQQAREMQGIVGQFQIDDSYLMAAQQQTAPAAPAKSAPQRPSPVRPAPARSAIAARPAARVTPRAAAHFDDNGFEEF